MNYRAGLGPEDGRRKKKRGGGAKHTDVVSFNSSGRPQLERALDRCGHGNFVMPQSVELHVPVAALSWQETHAFGDGLTSMKAKSKNGGWKL